MLLPELILIAAFVTSIVSGLFIDRLWKHSTFLISVVGIALAALSTNRLDFSSGVEGQLFGMVNVDLFGRHIRMLISAACLVFIFFVRENPDFAAHRKKTADLYSILLATHLGLNLMAIATNWLMVFVSIEMVSLGSYLMVGYLAKEKLQAEAAMKYVLFGAACSAVMLYGLSFLYGFTGDLGFTTGVHIAGLTEAPPLLVILALLLVFTGIGFKLSFVPFHFWTPDVYQGAPTPVTAFLSTAPKIAGIALLTRILYAWPTDSFAYQSLHLFILGSAVSTMLVGNLAALRQRNVKRMMAYSSIGHTGFLLMAVLAYSTGDHAVLLFYLAVYTLMNLAVFLLADYIESRTGAAHVDEYRGLGKTLPAAFVGFVILLVSLTGLPPTAGFVAKLLVFSTVFGQWQLTGNIGLLILLIVGALTTVISLFYYFSIPLHAFLRKREDEAAIAPSRRYILWLAVLFAVAMLVLGLFPGLLMGGQFG